MTVAMSRVFAVVFAAGLLDRDCVVFPADDVLDVGLEVTLGARSQFAEVGQDGVATLLRPGQHAASGNVPDCVLREHLAKGRHIPGVEGLVPPPDQFSILCGSHDRTPLRRPCRVMLGRLKG